MGGKAGTRMRRQGRGHPATRAFALAATLALPLASALPAPVGASPFGLFGAGPRGAAMGGALGSLADDFMAVYYNPAALVNSDRLVFGMGYSYLLSDLQLNGETLELSDTRLGLTSGGFSLAGPIEGYRLGAGLSFALPDQATIRAKLIAPTQQRYALLNNQTQVVEVAGGAALQLFPWLAFGGGLSLGAELNGVVSLQTNFFPPETSGILDTEVKTRTYPVGGILVTPMEGLRLGATYRGEYEIPLSLPTVDDLTLVEGSDAGAVLTLLIAQSYYFKPQQVELGISYDVWNRVTVGFDVVWIDWSTFPDPNPVGALDATGILAEVVNVPSLTPGEPPGFHDTWVPHFGLEAKVAKGSLWDLFLRLGYLFEPSPSPMKEGSTNLLDNDKHVGSAGFGLYFRDPWGILLGPASFEVSGQYVRFTERTVRKADPSDPSGDIVFGGDRFMLQSMVTFRFE